MVKRILIWAAVIFVVYYVATSPAGAGHFVHGAFNWLGHAGHSMAIFVNHL